MKTKLAQKIRNILTSAIVTTGLLSCMCVVGYSDTHYTRQGKIIEINQQQVSVLDTSGNVWMFVGQGYERNQNVMMTISTQGTDSIIKDDVITSVKTSDQ